MANLTIDRELLGKPKEKHWISYIRSRISKNKNFIAILTGQTGSGKSWSSLRIAEDLDPNFSIDQVVFDGLSLMELINSGKLKRGSVIVFEESGVELNNRNWNSVVNKMISYLVQTFRHRGFILILNCPYGDFVDTSIRKLIHAELSTQGINFTTSECRLKSLLLQYNSRQAKWYYKRLRVITSKGVLPIHSWLVPKPSNHLIDQYEVKKRQFTDDLNRRILEELQAVNNKTRGKKNNSELTAIQEETLQMLKDGYNVDKIAETRGRTKPVIWKTLELLKKKGYDFKGVYSGTTLTHYQVSEPGGI